MQIIKNLKKYYNIIFACMLSLLILYWFACIFFFGNASKQIALFFGRMSDFWADRTNVIGYSSLLDPYNNTMYSGLGEKAYPPLVYVIMYLFSRLVNMQPYYEANCFLGMQNEPLLLIFITIFVSLAFIFGYTTIQNGVRGSKLRKAWIALVLLFSGPMLFTLERGNIILWVPFLCLLFVLYHDSKKAVLKEVALISLAVAAGIKMTPAILGILLLYKHQWKEALRTVVYGLFFFLVPFMFLKGGLSNIPLMFRNLGYLMENYANSGGCSIRNVVDAINNLFHISINGSGQKIIAYLIGLVLIIYSAVAKKEWGKVMALSLAIIVVPNYSGYYNLLYLLPCIVLFVNDDVHDVSDFFVLLGLLLILNPVQSKIMEYAIDYRLGLLLIIIVLSIRCINDCRIRFADWRTHNDAEAKEPGG